LMPVVLSRLFEETADGAADSVRFAVGS